MEVQKKWFAEDNPVNAKGATAIIGDGTDGKVTITCDKVGTIGNDYEVKVAIATKASEDLAVVFANNLLTITLGTDDLSAADNTKNTATLIADAISAIDGFSAIASGTGDTAISTETTTNVEFAGGQFGTVCPAPYAIVKDNNYYYINIAPNSKCDANWRRFTLSDY